VIDGETDKTASRTGEPVIATARWGPPSSGLLDAQAGDGSADDELLDLLGAFEDVADLIRLLLQVLDSACELGN
jgi:hypothetical protein